MTDKSPYDMTDEEVEAAIDALAADGQQEAGNGAPTEPQVVDQPGMAQPTETSVPVEQPQPVNELEELKKELQRVKSEQGRQAKVFEENRALRRKLKALEEGKSRPAEPEPTSLPELTDEERALLGDETSAIFDERYRQTNRALQESREREAKLREQVDALVADNRQRSRNALNAELQTSYGAGIWEVEPGERWHEQWSAWRDRVNPLTRERNGDLFDRVYRDVDAEAVKTLLADYVSFSGYGAAQGGSAPQQGPANGSGQSGSVYRSANMGVAPQTSRAAQSATGATAQGRQQVQVTPELMRKAYDRAERDPAWAQSAEAKAVFEAIDNAALSGGLPYAY